MSVKKSVLVKEKGEGEDIFFRLHGAFWSLSENKLPLKCRQVSAQKGFPWGSERKDLNKIEDVKKYIYTPFSPCTILALLCRQARHILKKGKQGGKEKGQKSRNRPPRYIYNSMHSNRSGCNMCRKACWRNHVTSRDRCQVFLARD